MVPGSILGVAGTGTIAVINDSGDSAVSNTDLVVNFSRIEILSANSRYYSPDLYNENGQGGHTFLLNNDFVANQPAVDALIWCMQNHTCTSTVNFRVGVNTAVDLVADDSIHVIRFDDGNELPDGVYGLTSLKFLGCNFGNDYYWTPSQIDMTLDDGTPWQYGPDNPKAGTIDFRSVVMHELGHVHMLLHVINTEALMHSAIGNGKKRRWPLETADVLGMDHVISSSSQPKPCGGDPMVVADTSWCLNSIDEGQIIPTPNNGILAYPNPTTGQLYIIYPNIRQSSELVLTDMLGRTVRRTILQISTNNTAFDLSSLPSGIYFLQLLSDVSYGALKIVVK